MSDRPTPETDAFFAEWTRTNGVLARSRLHAEKLERERDEAMEHCNKAKRLFESSERARASLNEALDKTLHELREAREQNAKLRDIAEKAITAVALWAGSRTNSASKLRAELDQLKEGAK